MNNQAKAVLFAVTAVLIWSTVASAFKITLDHMDPSTMVFIASLVSLVSIALASMVNGDWKDIRECGRKEMMKSMATGILNPFLYYIVLFGSYDLLQAQIAQSINYSWPVVFTLLSIAVLKQKISKRSALGVCIGFIGVLVVSTKGFSLSGSGINGSGILLAVGSAFIWAGFWTLNLRDGARRRSRLFFNFLGGSILITLLMLFTDPVMPGIRGWGGAVYIGLFEMGVTFLIWMKALSLSRDNARIAMLIYMSPFISLVFINLLVGEAILLSTIIGLLIIVAGIVIQRTGKGRIKGMSFKPS